MPRRIPTVLVIVLLASLVDLVLVQRTARAKAQTKGTSGQFISAATLPEATGINNRIETVKAQVLEYGKKFGLALKKKNAAAALNLMASNWAYSNERGETISGQQWVAARVSPSKAKNLVFPFMQHVDVKWHVFGNNVVVETGRSNSILSYKGKLSHGPRRETAVYTKIGGHWVQASLHVGFIPQEQRDFTFPAGALPTGITTPNPNSPPPKRRFLQMAGYQDATGINSGIAEVKTQLLRVVAKQHQAVKGKDSMALLATMASNWAYSSESGHTLSKTHWGKAALGKSSSAVFPGGVDVEWHVFGNNIVVVTARGNSKAHGEGGVSTRPWNKMAVYTKIDGKWVQASLDLGALPK